MQRLSKISGETRTLTRQAVELADRVLERSSESMSRYPHAPGSTRAPSNPTADWYSCLLREVLATASEDTRGEDNHLFLEAVETQARYTLSGITDPVFDLWIWLMSDFWTAEFESPYGKEGVAKTAREQLHDYAESAFVADCIAAAEEIIREDDAYDPPNDLAAGPKIKWSFNDDGFESHVDLGDIHSELKARS